jgi:hydroxybutyrate-dimer hydrolase
MKAGLAIRSSTFGQHETAGAEVDHVRVAAGVSEVRASGKLHGKPAIILHGRSDALLAPNHTSRAYYGRNKVVERDNSQVRSARLSQFYRANVALPAWMPLPRDK